MQKYNIKELVKDNMVRFDYYKSGELWFEIIKYVKDYTEDTTWRKDVLFKFPVPIIDCENAKFLREDKAILYMRYIRKYISEIEKEQSLQDIQNSRFIHSHDCICGDKDCGKIKPLKP